MKKIKIALVLVAASLLMLARFQDVANLAAFVVILAYAGVCQTEVLRNHGKDRVEGIAG